MADEEKVTTEEQALADEWAAALAEAGDASQDDIDALMAQGGATPWRSRAPRGRRWKSSALRRRRRPFPA